MEFVIGQMETWLRGVLTDGIRENLTGLFDAVNLRIGEIAGEVGQTPSDFAPEIYTMIRNLSETVILPVAGMVLTFVACSELIRMVLDHNNLANLDTWIFFRWVFKTFAAVLLITHTFDIVMAVFDVAQSVVRSSAGILSAETAVDGPAAEQMEAVLAAMETGPLLGLYLQTFVIRLTMMALSVLIFVITYGRMIEIYLLTSLAPIPFATFGSQEQRMTGQNYLRSLCALAFQGFLILVCVGIYAVLIQGISGSGDMIAAIWGVLGYTVLLCFTLFQTGSLSMRIFGAR